MPTWFNLAIAKDLIPDNRSGTERRDLQLTRVALFNSEARPLTAMFSCVSRTRALEQIAEIGMRTFDSPRLLLYLKEPHGEPMIFPIAGPHEQDDSWVEPAVERLKLSGKV